MLARSTALALSLCLAVPCAAGAQGFEYAPGTAKYRVVQKTKSAESMMGQKNEYETTSSQVMTVTVARAAKDTLAMTVVLDSMSSTNSTGIPMPNLERFVGMKVLAKVSPSASTVYSVAGPTEDQLPNSSALTTAMGGFLPKMGGKLAKGATWADTTSGKIRQGGIDIDRKTFSRYTVLGDTAVGGERSWKIARSDSTALSGSGTGQGGPMTMEGTSTGKGTLLVNAKGAFVGAEGDEESNIRIVLSANGMEIGVAQTANTKVEKVK